MCKLLIIPGVTKETNSDVQDIIFEMKKHMSIRNDDGLGYSMLTKEGKLSGCRWLDNNDAFRDFTSVPKESFTLANEEYKGVLEPMIPIKFGTFGEEHPHLDNMRAITLHTRFATCAKTFENVHPFVSPDGNTTLIHNGVIRNHESLTKITSTNDSETILHQYLKHDVTNNIDAIQNVADDLKGYYACAVFSKQANGEVILDIFKEDQARLSGVLIKELGQVVFTTDFEDIKATCKELGLTISQIYKFKDNHIIRLNPLTGKVIDHRSFKSSGKYEYSGSYWQQWQQQQPNIQKVDEKGKEGEKTTKETPSDKSGISGMVVVQGMTDKQLTNATNKYLNKRMTEESKSIICVSEIRQRLIEVDRENKLEKIVSGLKEEFNFEQFYDENAKEFFIRRKTS